MDLIHSNKNNTQWNETPLNSLRWRDKLYNHSDSSKISETSLGRNLQRSHWILILVRYNSARECGRRTAWNAETSAALDGLVLGSQWKWALNLSNCAQFKEKWPIGVWFHRLFDRVVGKMEMNGKWEWDICQVILDKRGDSVKCNCVWEHFDFWIDNRFKNTSCVHVQFKNPSI